jgi:hypothetical protein
MQLRDLYIRIDPKKIAFLKFIVEGYDGLALLTTIDKHEGLVRLLVPATRHIELMRLLEELVSSSWTFKPCPVR